MGKFYRIDPQTKQLVEIGDTEPVDAHSVITDEIPALLNHVDGKYYTSKSELRRKNKELGCIEYGTEDISKFRRKPERSQKEIEASKQQIAKIYNDLAIAGGRNEALRNTPQYSEYMKKMQNG